MGRRRAEQGKGGRGRAGGGGAGEGRARGQDGNSPSLCLTGFLIKKKKKNRTGLSFVILNLTFYNGISMVWFVKNVMIRHPGEHRSLLIG